MLKLTPEMLIAGYCQGVFPMAIPEENNEIFWFEPEWRCVFPVETFSPSKTLRRLMKQGIFDITMDTAFRQVIEACAERPIHERWISKEIIDTYSTLFSMGLAHSVEVWHHGNLAGGLYGVQLHRAFFGESMFHRKSNASKVALVYLIHYCREQNIILLDAQYATPHLISLGAVEIPKEAYLANLQLALES